MNKKQQRRLIKSLRGTSNPEVQELISIIDALQNKIREMTIEKKRLVGIEEMVREYTQSFVQERLDSRYGKVK